MSLIVIPLRDPRDLTAWEPAWERLSERAAEANVFMEPWFLGPALRELRGDAPGPVTTALVVDGDSPKTSTLHGIFPLTTVRSLMGVPLPHVAVWRHPLMLLGTPLVDRKSGFAALDALLRWCGRQVCGNALHLSQLTADGAVARWLNTIAGHRGLPTEIFDPHERAALTPTWDAEAHLRQVMKRKRRKEIQRLMRRLADDGERSVRHFDSGPELQGAIERFLVLEAQGWKGRQDTALASRPQTDRFVRAAFDGATRRGRLSIQELTLNGEVVASKVNLLTPVTSRGAFAFKIVYDERFSDYSPGVQLEVENLDWAHRHPDVGWMDSCAAPDHPMIDKLWLDRRHIESRVVATDTLRGRLAVQSLAGLRLARRVWKQTRAEAPSA